jgi:hypothetical protein
LTASRESSFLFSLSSVTGNIPAPFLLRECAAATDTQSLIFQPDTFAELKARDPGSARLIRIPNAAYRFFAA